MKHVTILILVLSSLLLTAQEKNAKELFSFKPDERVFTVYALMNGAGYFHDHLGADKIRVEVTEYLDSNITPELKKKIKDFYYAHGYENDSSIHFWNYTKYALWLSEPPDFNVICDSCPKIVNEWTGFNTLIKEFYQEANIKELFHQYEGDLLNMNMEYKPYADSAINCITTFCKLPPDYYHLIAKKIYFNLNPLMSHWTAQTELVNGELYLINGLGKDTDIPSIEAFLHEPLHHVVNPIVDSNKTLLENSEILYDFSLKNGFEKLYAYPAWRYIVIDGFVRFLTHYINYTYNTHDLDNLEKMIYGDYKLGFLLLPYFYEHINDFNASNISISDFYNNLMRNIDFEKEKNRMVEFKKENQ